MEPEAKGSHKDSPKDQLLEPEAKDSHKDSPKDQVLEPEAKDSQKDRAGKTRCWNLKQKTVTETEPERPAVGT